MAKLSIMGSNGVLLILILSTELCSCMLKEVYSWNVFDLQFPNDSIKQSQSTRGFDRRDVIVENFEVWNDKLFLKLDRKSGRKSPIVIGYVDLSKSAKTKYPQLFAYPDWDSNQNYKDLLPMSGIDHMHVDECDRLWLLNSGFTVTNRPAKVFVYDLKTNRRLREHVINSTDYQNNRIIDMAVDASKTSCDKSFAYITRHSGNIVTVYDFENDKSWWVKVRFDPKNQPNKQSIGTCFAPDEEEDGKIKYITLLASQKDGYRGLDFRSGFFEFKTTTKILRNKPGSDTSYPFEYIGCGVFADPKSIMDPTTGAILRPVNQTISCRNCNEYTKGKSCTKTEYDTKEKNLKIEKIISGGNGTLTLLFSPATNLADLFKPLDENESNFKLATVPSAEVVKGFVC